MNGLSSRLTPIDDAYETCNWTEATLAVYYVDPELVTQKLGVSPTSSERIGVPRTMPSGRVQTGTMHNWLLSSEGQVASKDIRRHLDWLLDKVEPTRPQLLKLQQLAGVKMAVRCVWWSAYGGGGPTLWPEQMRRIAELNLECTFSFAYYGSDVKPE